MLQSFVRGPHVSFEATGFTNEMNFLLQGMPDKDKIDVGRQVSRAIGDRIRTHSSNASGQALDAVEGVTEDIKEAAGQQTGAPLVATSEMTEPSAFDVVIEGGDIVFKLKPEHHEKWDNIIGIALEDGKNWDTAFDLGPNEQGLLYEAIDNWIQDNLGSGFKPGPALGNYRDG